MSYQPAVLKTLLVAILVTSVGCIEGGHDDDDNAEVGAEAAALEVLDLHLVARNSLDPELISSVNNYPNLRLVLEFDNGTVFETYESYRDFEEQIVMPLQEASEWDYSKWEEVSIIQSSANKVHLAVNWSRINTDGDTYVHRPQFYIVTNQDGHWGIKIRSPTRDVDLLTHESSRIDPEAEDTAIALLNNYMEARNRRDSESLAALNHYPLVYLYGVDLQIFDLPEDYIAFEENTVIHELDYAGCDRAEIDSFEIIQSSPTKVHLTYSSQRLNSVGECADAEEGLWIVTKVEDRWGILGRSMF